MNRLEKHIKTELQNREIAPSSDAWSKISKELKIDEKPPSRNRFWWAVAAGFTGIVLIASLFFGNKSSLQEVDSPIVVEKEANPVTPEENKDPVQTDKAGLTAPQNESVVETLPEADQLKEEGLFDAPQEKESLAQHHQAKDTDALNDVAGVSEMAINDKLEAIMEQVNDMENNALVITDAEIDSMLLAAQRELLTQKVFSENGEVDAMALLGEVELELYDDQQNPLFNTLKEGFFRLRTAVADRNK